MSQKTVHGIVLDDEKIQRATKLMPVFRTLFLFQKRSVICSSWSLFTAKSCKVQKRLFLILTDSRPSANSQGSLWLQVTILRSSLCSHESLAIFHLLSSTWLRCFKTRHLFCMQNHIFLPSSSCPGSPWSFTHSFLTLQCQSLRRSSS